MVNSDKSDVTAPKLSQQEPQADGGCESNPSKENMPKQDSPAAWGDTPGQFAPCACFVTGEQLLETARNSSKPYHLEQIEKALRFATRAHEG